MPNVRIGLIRLVAVALIAAQVGAYALSPYAEARAGGAAGQMPTIEQQHGDDCVVLHRPDHCLACQLLSLRFRAMPTAAPLPLITARLVRSAPGRARIPLPARLAVSHDSRGPPVTTA
jgi:hypothetical protein